MPHYIESRLRDTAGGLGCHAKCKCSGNRVWCLRLRFMVELLIAAEARVLLHKPIHSGHKLEVSCHELVFFSKNTDREKYRTMEYKKDASRNKKGGKVTAMWSYLIF